MGSKHGAAYMLCKRESQPDCYSYACPEQRRRCEATHQAPERSHQLSEDLRQGRQKGEDWLTNSTCLVSRVTGDVIFTWTVTAFTRT